MQLDKEVKLYYGCQLPNLTKEQSDKIWRRPKQRFYFFNYSWNIDVAILLFGNLKPTNKITPKIWIDRMAGGIEGTGLIEIRKDNISNPELDLKYPVFQVKLENDAGYMIIDGWTRLYKAVLEEVERLDAILLTSEQEKVIRRIY